LFRAAASVVDAGAYQVGAQPYLLSQVTAAALEELKRRKAAAKKAASAAPRKPLVDPEAMRQRAEAHALLSEARKRHSQVMEKADAIEAEAKSDADALKKKAWEEGMNQGLTEGRLQGHSEGLAKGEEEGLARWAELISRWKGILEETVHEKHKYLADRERVLVELVMKVCAKILMREVKENPADIQRRVNEAVRRSTDRNTLMVYLNPEDLSKAAELGSNSFRSLGGVKQIEFLADEKVIRGGLRLESTSETIDAGMDTQLTQMVRGLLEEAYHAD
jgi:flagellar assembly protein FliH